jgi:cytochrome c oxidase assembly protein subunit 11
MALALAGIVAGMVGLSFASVPLYRMICQAIGLDGTPKTKNVAAAPGATERTVTVRFDANVNSALPWQFRPEQRQVTVHLGEQVLTSYLARNAADHAVAGTATFNVVPAKAAQYFNKIECFCFIEQTLAAGQEVSMPVLFYVDPRLADDPEAADVTQITLSYTFFPVEDAGASRSVAGSPAGSGG